MGSEVWIEKDIIWCWSMRYSSGLSGSCSYKRGPPKKSLDHTLLLNLLSAALHELHWHTLYDTTKLLQDWLNSWLYAGWVPNAYLWTHFLIPWLYESQWWTPLNTSEWHNTSRSFLYLPHHSTHWECSGSFFSLAGRSNRYTNRISCRISWNNSLIKHSWLPILRIVRVKLSISHFYTWY
jgi:hypothetical protein